MYAQALAKQNKTKLNTKQSKAEKNINSHHELHARCILCTRLTVLTFILPSFHITYLLVNYEYMHKSCTSDHCEGASSKSTFAGKLFSDFIFSPSLSLSLSICSSFTFCHSLRLLSVAIDGWIIFPFNSIMSVHRHIAHICRRLIQFIGSAGWMCTMHMISDKIKYYLMDFMVGNIEMIECNFRLISAWMFVSKKSLWIKPKASRICTHLSLSFSGKLQDSGQATQQFIHLFPLLSTWN